MQQSEAVNMPFTVDAALQMLAWGASPDSSPYSHKQIAEWCDRFWCKYLDIDPPESIAKLLPLLTDVETQWDLFLTNTYSLEQLRTNDFEHVRLPVEWFEKWLREAKA